MKLLDSVDFASKDFLKSHVFNKPAKKAPVRVLFDGSADSETVTMLLDRDLPKWQTKALAESTTVQGMVTSKDGPIYVLRPAFYDTDNRIKGHEDKLVGSGYGRARDVAGQWLRLTADPKLGDISFEFSNVSNEEILGALVGLGLASYKYKDAVKEKSNWQSKIYFTRDKGSIDEGLIKQAMSMATAMNIGRHVTNAPGGDLNPESMSQIVKSLFAKKKNVKVEIWGPERLKKEKMGLLLGVGQGSTHGSRLIHIRYRPNGKSRRVVAIVGKGVTFDTGGLDIKPSSGMRMMKKDMAGSGTVLALAYYAQSRGIATPCDFYLAMSENSINDQATRPGDIHIARNGKSVEIHNTDAEGRLCLADALDVAVTQQGRDEPTEVINVATLTGAMRVSLGLDVAGFFSNNDTLAADLETASQSAGEMAWRMPLIQKYKKQLASSFADMSNASDSGFGGAISAALFLEAFVREKSWAHFDVMSWNQGSEGAFTDGANTQCFQLLANYLENIGTS